MKKFLLLTTLMSTNAFAAPSQYIGLSSSGFSWNTEKTKAKDADKASSFNRTDLNVNLQYGYQVHKYVNVGAYLGATYLGVVRKDTDAKTTSSNSLFNFNLGLVSEINFMGDFANSPYLGIATGLTYRVNTTTPYIVAGTAGTAVKLPKGFGFELSPYLGYNIPLTALGATNVVFAPEIGYKMTIQMGDDNKKTPTNATPADSIMNHAVVVKLGFKLLF